MLSIHYVRDNACVIRLENQMPQVDWYIDRYIDSLWTYWGDEYDTAKDEYEQAEREMYEQLDNLVHEYGRVTVHPLNVPRNICDREYMVITLCDFHERVEYYVVRDGKAVRYGENNVRAVSTDMYLSDMYNEMRVEW